MKRFVAIILAVLTMAMTFVSCSNADPNVKQKSEKDDNYVVDTAEDTTGDASDINSEYYAIRGYELKYLLAIEKFDSPSEISASKLVQYAFCRVYYNNLVDMPREGVKMREATAEQINAQIQKDFGKVNVDITTADLYNKGKKKFEMWEPLYGMDLYTNSSATSVGDNSYEIQATYYSDEAKTTVIGSATITVNVQKDGSQYIAKLA